MIPKMEFTNDMCGLEPDNQLVLAGPPAPRVEEVMALLQQQVAKDRNSERVWMILLFLVAMFVMYKIMVRKMRNEAREVSTRMTAGLGAAVQEALEDMRTRLDLM